MELNNVIIFYSDSPYISYSNGEITIQITKIEDIEYLLKNKLKNALIEELSYSNDESDILFIKNTLKYLENNEINISDIISPNIILHPENLNKEYSPLSDMFEEIIYNIRQLKDIEVYHFLNNNKFKDKAIFLYKYNKIGGCNFEDLNRTINKTTELTNAIASFDLSPIEQLMFVYDLVRKNVYKDNTGDCEESRDLTKVYSGNNIVCAGYANLFDAMCENLGLDSKYTSYKMENKDRGHAANTVFVNDDKYDIHEIFEMDATWCSNSRDNNYLNYYSTFAIPVFKAEEVKKKKGFILQDHWDRVLNNRIKNYNSFIENKAPKAIYGQTIDLIYKELINLCERIGDTKLAKECLFHKNKGDENFMEQVQKFNNHQRIINIKSFLLYNKREYLDRFISPNTFIKILYNVRSVENMIDPVLYPNDDEKLIQIGINFYGENFKMELRNGLYEVKNEENNNTLKKLK